jgi:predicted ABC-type ATPase
VKRPQSIQGAWDIQELDNRPIIVCVAGPNGAGKTTFFEAHLKRTGLRFLNADVIARELSADPYEAAVIVGKLRQELIDQGVSFIFETVFSDPVGDKLAFLRNTAQRGYTIALCFIGIADAASSEERVAMRVTQGGHDVPTLKLIKRFPRTMLNPKRAVAQLPLVCIFDNDDLRVPFRLVAIFRDGTRIFAAPRLPSWLKLVSKRV